VSGPRPVEEMLEERARRLALPRHRHVEDGAATGLLLRFTAGGEGFAVEIGEVAAVARPLSLTPLPGAAAPLRAAATWRGRVVSVLDVASLQGEGAAACEGTRCHMIVFVGGRVAVLTDDAPEVSAGERKDLAPPATRSRLIKAMLPDGVVLLDGSALRGDVRPPREDAT
jgi:chemotaxis signal transduction protein